MAFELLDEHEQGEVVRKWLRQNTMSIATGIALALLLIFGWQQWKHRQDGKAVEAALQYQALGVAVEGKRTEDADAIAAALRKDYPGTVYAVLAALGQAERAVVKGDLKAAAPDLDWARSNVKLPALKHLVNLRLAQVRLAEGDAAAALGLLESIDKAEYVGQAAELRGDALVKLDRDEEARAAYRDALAKLDPQAPNRSFVQMKLDDLGAAPAAAQQGS
ncbi:MAG: tetratricopeptide repeat protein [Dokdonella sp.]|nr:tetratricopeptide repeat protein [Dokdonella sp.]